MSFFLNNIYQRFLSKEIKRFTVVGTSTVLLDLLCYYLLINTHHSPSFSKGTSFTIGAIYAYIVNKNFTFRSKNWCFIQFCIFIFLYISTLAVNVIINELVLWFFDKTNLSFILGFLSATFFSATLNFLGMKYIVFVNKNV